MAVPDPEASVNFMPELWRKIEARQFFLARLKKLTQVFVAAAAAICLLLGIAAPGAGCDRTGKWCAAITSTCWQTPIPPRISPLWASGSTTPNRTEDDA